jgi:hypothetical protein
MIKRCPNCVPHEFQDRRYGNLVRLFTTDGKGNAKTCTVCGKQENSSSVIKKGK